MDRYFGWEGEFVFMIPSPSQLSQMRHRIFSHRSHSCRVCRPTPSHENTSLFTWPSFNNNDFFVLLVPVLMQYFFLLLIVQTNRNLSPCLHVFGDVEYASHVYHTGYTPAKTPRETKKKTPPHSQNKYNINILPKKRKRHPLPILADL